MANQTTPTPVINQEQPARTWFIGDIYNPQNPTATGQYVPNVNDLIWDYTQGWFRVTAVDYTTGLSTLTLWELPKQPDQNDTLDVLLGAGPGTVADSYRAFIDTSVKPSILALDRRLYFYGTTVTSIKVFLGTDISATGTVISQYYDQNWNLLGENIPLELVGTNPDNLAIKTPKVGYTTTTVPDGELLTVVAYDDVGGAVSTAKVVSQNSTFIRTADAASKYITSINLESPFLSQADPTVIQYPINMPVAALNLMGKVTYSDGSVNVLPVDQTKFSLFGLDEYIATQQGQTLPVVLSYLLSQGEYNYIGSQSNNSRITREYSAQTLPMDGAFSIKLFVFPVWQNVLSGYSLRFFLYNLDRQNVYDVTNLVQAGGTTPAFNPVLYGVQQNVAFAVNMNQVDPAYPSFRFVQTFSIALLRQGTDTSGDNWTVTYTPNQSPAYGIATQAKAKYIEVGNWSLDLSCGLTNFNDWINKLYYAAQPLVNPQSEVMAPVPNIMALYINNTRYEFPVTSWNTLLTVTTAMPEGSVVFIEWILRSTTNDLQLGISGLIVHNVS